MYKKFKQIGSVATIKRTVKARSVRTAVVLHFTEHPNNSQRKAASQLGISRSSLQRLMKSLKFKPYRPRLLQELSEDDFDRRLEFCEQFLARMIIQPDLAKVIVSTDEAQFKLNGLVNRHNSIYWSDKNPHLVVTQALNCPGVHV